MFWIDPFLLIAAGVFIAILAKRVFYEEKEAAWVYGSSAVILFVFLFVSIGMFCDLRIMGRFAQPFYDMLEGQGATGTAFMVNGGLLHILPKNATLADVPHGLMFTCIFMFVLYPAYLWLGVVLGRLLFGRKPQHLGMIRSKEIHDAENLRIK